MLQTKTINAVLNLMEAVTIETIVVCICRSEQDRSHENWELLGRVLGEVAKPRSLFSRLLLHDS